MPAANSDGTYAEKRRLFRHMEIMIAVLLGVTAFIGAASAFQQSQIDSKATVALSEAGQLRTAAIGYKSTATQVSLADQAIFLQYEQAKESGNSAYADFVLTRLMSSNLRATTNWWEAQSGEVTLFDAGSPYQNPYFDKAVQANAEADQRMVDYQRYDEQSTTFAKAVTLLAVSLFFFGTAAVVSRQVLRVSAIVLGIAVIVIASLLVVFTNLI